MSRGPFAGQRIGVLMGGHSTEREISLRSGAAVSSALKRRGYDVVEADPAQGFLERFGRLDRSGRPFDAAYIALHGRGGEDGQVQALLEWLRMPYTGSGILASALAMNKLMTKRLLMAEQIPTPRSYPLPSAGTIAAGLAGVERLPVVVKPASEGSTVGISIVRDPAALPAALELAGRYGGEVLVEDYIDGHELTVGILDDAALPPIEIVPREAFYNYEAKYTPGRCDYLLPPTNVAALVCREAQELAVRVHRLLGCSGATRVDFRIDRTGAPYVLEINTVPGMTETSLLPRAAAAAGFDYDELVVRILSSAKRRIDRGTTATRETA